MPVVFGRGLGLKLTLYLSILLIVLVPSFSCRLGEVTLKDFKAAVDRGGNHRYHFKALDPEFGTVKEEVQHPWGIWVVLLVILVRPKPSV